MHCLQPLVLVSAVAICYCSTYNVKLDTEAHVNEVADNFLSFSIDPKYLFSPNETYSSKECMCMASSLSPAYLRIAGPSTDSLVFNESSILLGVDEGKKVKVSPEQWQKFAAWANSSDFQLVFALNPTEKSASGMWDANSAISLLTSADQSGLQEIVWELGYECSNQTIEEYLNDLQTLKMIVETFPYGQTEDWKVVAGDISRCLETESKSDFKDYVTLSDEILDAVLLNGNTSSQQLKNMSDKDRLKLLKLFSSSKTPLWLTEKLSSEMTEFERAVDWLTSLGYSAKNGFNVHFRELREDELYEPTLSFYMALLHKNLVGQRVLNVRIEELGETVLFAHCTSLRHKPIPGAVTLFGVNMDEETARFSIKLSRIEEGGDIMQFILRYDADGNIIVNGRPMLNEGDMRPVVKRVRPYKTLLLNLPPKSFGFWVLANTNIEACIDVVSNEIDGKRFLEAIPVNNIDEGATIEAKQIIKRSERSIHEKININDVADSSDNYYTSFDGEIKNLKGNNIDGPISYYSKELLSDLVDKMARDLKFVFYSTAHKRATRDVNKKLKRKNGLSYDIKNNRELRIKRKEQTQPESILPAIRSGLLRRLMERHNRFNNTRIQRISKLKSKPLLYKNKLLKRSAFDKRRRPNSAGTKDSVIVSNEMKTKQIHNNTNIDNAISHNRTRRNIISTRDSKLYTENEINDTNETELYKIMKTLQKSFIPVKISEIYVEDQNNTSSQENNIINEEIDLKTTLTEDNASVKIIEKTTKDGLMATILENANSLLYELKNRMHNFWKLMNSVE